MKLIECDRCGKQANERSREARDFATIVADGIFTYHLCFDCWRKFVHEFIEDEEDGKNNN